LPAVGQGQGADSRALVRASRVRSVRFPLAPLLDESWPGYLTRITGWNGLQHAGVLLQEAGAPAKMDVGHSVQEHLPSLASILKVEELELRRILIVDDASQSHSSYFGLKLKRSRLLRSIRRVSPRALRASAHHRAAWLIDVLPYCSEGWDYLIDRCPSEGCGARLGWSGAAAIDLCEHCGFDLKLAPSPRVQCRDRPALEFLTALVSPDETRRQIALERVPAPFKELKAASLFELIVWFSRALLLIRKSRLSPKGNLSAPHLAAGTRMVLDYPASFRDVFGDSGEHDVVLDGRSRFFSYLLMMARSDHYEKDVDEFLTRFLAEHGQASRARYLLKHQRQTRGEMTIGMAAASLGIEKADVRKLINDGVLKPSYEHGHARKSAWLSPDRVDQVGIALRGRISSAEFAKTNGIPLEGIEQLISLGLICIERNRVLRSLYDGMQLNRHSSSKFLESLRDVVSRPQHPSPSVALSDAFVAIGGAKPWGAILKAAVERKLPEPLTIELGAPTKIDRLMVSIEFVRDLAAGRYPHLLAVPMRSPELGAPPDFSRSEVERFLNCYPRDVTWLRVNGHLPNDDSGGRCFERARVEQLGGHLISSREISWRWRVSPEAREDLSIKHGIQRALGPFWPRAEVNEHFSRLFSSGGTHK
jgi:hypothetical protein